MNDLTQGSLAKNLLKMSSFMLVSMVFQTLYFLVGLRLVQAGFMPVVAMGFAVSPVAGQNFGARLGGRVRETFRVGALMASGFMVVLTLMCQLVPEQMIGLFSRDAQVLRVGGEYLRITSVNFLASGIIFVSSSMFQALGNTIPPLLSSVARILIVAIPAVLLSRVPGFELRWIWYLAVVGTTVQVVANVVLLRREYRRKLAFAELPAVALPA